MYEALARNAAEVIREFELNELDFVDIGGGFYGGGPKNVGAYERYASVIAGLLSPVCDPSRTKLVVEPARGSRLHPCVLFRARSRCEGDDLRSLRDLRSFPNQHRPRDEKRPLTPTNSIFRRNAVRPDVSCGRTPEAIGGGGASVRARRSRIVPRYLVRFYAAIPAWKATGFALSRESAS